MIYLQDTQYACNGAGGFFKKLVETGDDYEIPEFLSDHPVSKNRIADIDAKAAELACNTDFAKVGSWNAFKDLLPSAVDTTAVDSIQVAPEPIETEE